MSTLGPRYVRTSAVISTGAVAPAAAIGPVQQATRVTIDAALDIPVGGKFTALEARVGTVATDPVTATLRNAEQAAAVAKVSRTMSASFDLSPGETLFLQATSDGGPFNVTLTLNQKSSTDADGA